MVTAGAMYVYPDGQPKAPWPLWLFGEERLESEYLYLPETASDDEVARVQSLFPETRVVRDGEQEDLFDPFAQ